jgi:Ser/Thr protein kinase RdoA (MazF antagonist)
MINKTRDAAVQPFSGLTPEVVLDAAAAAGLEPDGRLFALNSYENRVYQLWSGERGLVLKFYRPARWSDAQIAEEHTFTLELAAAELPVAAPLVIGAETLLRYHDYRFAAFPFLRGRSPDLDAPEARQMLGRTLARLHQVGARRPFAARPRIGVERFGWQARAQVLNGTLLPERQQERYAQVSSALLEKVAGSFALAGAYAEIRLHGDCHLGNLLWNEQGPVFVDLDDCAMGPRVQDMWMVISGSADEQQHQWGELLEGYRQFADFDYAQVRLIEPLRALRMLHHAAWVTHRWDDPAFPRAFPWFGEERYWEGYLRDLMEQIEQIEDPPLLRGDSR